MNNKPVAWIDKDTLDATHIIKAIVRREQDEQHTIPLFTHPVKELTDEEIIEVIEKSPIAEDIGMYRTGIEFAKAILRKAQEK